MITSKKSQNIVTVTSLLYVLAAGYASPALAKKEVDTRVGVVGANSAKLSVISETGKIKVLQQGDAIRLNDILKTDENGRAQILFKDRSTIMIKENSQIRIDKFVYDPEKQEGKLAMTAARGVLRFIGGALSKKQPVEITTPVATIGIRGGVADTYIDDRTGKTESTFLYGDSLNVQSGGQSQTITTPSTALSVNEVGAPIQTIPQSQVEQNLLSFSNIEGGATEGAVDTPTRENVQAKTSEMSAAVPVEDQSSDAGAVDGGDAKSSDGSSSSSDASGDGGNDGGDAQPSDASGGSAGAGEASPAAASPADGGAALGAPVAAPVVVDTSAAQAASQMATSVAVDSVKDDKVVEFTAPTSPKDPVVPPVGSGTGGALPTNGTGGDPKAELPVDPTVPVVPTSDTSSNDLPKVKVPNYSEVTDQTLQGQYVALQGVNTVTASGGASVNHINTVDTSANAVVSSRWELASPTVTLANGSTAGLSHLASSSTSSADGALDTWLYNSPDGTMKYFHMVNADATKQFNVIAGQSMTASALDGMVSGYSVFRRLPDLDRWFTTAEMSAAFARGIEGTGMVVDWAKDRMLFAKLPWYLEGSAIDKERVIASAVLGSSGTGLSGVAVSMNGNILTNSTLSAPLSQIYSDGAAGVEGLLLAHDNGGTVDYTPLERVAAATPAFLNQTSTDASVATYKNSLTVTDSGTSNLKGFTGGLVQTTDFANRLVFNDNIDNVQVQRNASNGTVGVSVNFRNTTNSFTSTTTSGMNLGDKASAASTLMTNNTYVASNAAGTAYAASGNLVSGAAQCNDCRYTQWGVWGGSATVGDVTAQADIVPYVVGEVTQNIASSGLTGSANYEGVANASVAVNGVANQYSGDMSASVNFATRNLSSLNIALNDVGGAGRTLELYTTNLAAIADTGAATFNAPLYVTYNGYYVATSNAVTNGALFGSDAQEIGGNFKFSGVSAGDGSILRAGGVYQGVQQ